MTRRSWPITGNRRWGKLARLVGWQDMALVDRVTVGVVLATWLYLAGHMMAAGWWTGAICLVVAVIVVRVGARRWLL